MSQQQPSPTRELVVEMLQGADDPLSIQEIGYQIGSPYQSVRRILSDLFEDSMVDREGSGVRGDPYQYVWIGDGSRATGTTVEKLRESEETSSDETESSFPVTLREQPDDGPTWDVMEIEDEPRKLVALVDDERYTFTGSDVDMVLSMEEMAEDTDHAWNAVVRYGEWLKGRKSSSR